MNPTPAPAANSGAPPALDGQLVRRLLGMPTASDDESVNRAMGQLAAERKGVQSSGAPAQTLDEGLFRSMLDIDPATSTNDLNATILRFLVKEKTVEQDVADPAPGTTAPRQSLAQGEK